MVEEKQILIVDDVLENVLFIVEILDQQGYSHETAKDGEEALRKLRESPPDLVLLDMMMPGRTGLAVIRVMKEDPVLKKIPVIIITGAPRVTGVDPKTGHTFPPEHVSDEFPRAFGSAIHDMYKEVEPDGLIEKPIDPKVLVEKIKEILA